MKSLVKFLQQNLKRKLLHAKIRELLSSILLKTNIFWKCYCVLVACKVLRKEELKCDAWLLMPFAKCLSVGWRCFSNTRWTLFSEIWILGDLIENRNLNFYYLQPQSHFSCMEFFYIGTENFLANFLHKNSYSYYG